MRVITRLNVGGPTIQALDLHRELGKEHSTCLVTGYATGSEGAMEFERGFGSGISQIPYLGRELNLKTDYKAFRLLLAHIKAFQPDIIHTHQAKAGALTRLAALFIKPMPKLVHTYHGHVFHFYFGKWKTKLIVLAERFLAKFTDVIIAISESQKRELVEVYRIAPAHKVRVIPNGFDLSNFLVMDPILKDNRWSGEKNRLAVGIVGRLAPVKNHELFFDFCLALSEHFVIEVHVIGDGPRHSELVSKYGYLFTARHIPSYFRKGWSNHWEMPLVYDGLDIVVNSSKNEGTPAVLIEAMAAGRLVVATSVGGNVDLVGGQGIRGFFLYEDNIYKTIHPMKEWLEFDGFKVILGEAREYVKTRHSLDRLVKDITTLYESLL